MPKARAIRVPLEDVEDGHGRLGFRCGLFYGWVVVALCILCKVWKCQGQNNIMSYTVPHLLEDFGLSHSELGSMFAVATLSASTVQPSIGCLADRFGSRVCIPATQLLLCATLLVFSVWRPPRAKAFLYAEVVFVFFFLRAICLGAAETFTNACLQQWFKRRRGRAVSLTNTCQQLGNSIAAPVVSGLVAGAGWRFAMQAGAAANFVLAPVSLLLLRRCPEDCGLLPDGDGVAAPGGCQEDDAKPGGTVAAQKRAGEPESAGGGQAGESTAPGGAQAADKHGSAEELPKGLWQLFTFAFFYAVIFGGVDFYMVEMTAEAAGPFVVRVSDHIFAPLALTTAVLTPFVGELMDQCSQKRQWIPALLLAFCGFLTALVTQMTCIITSPAVAVIYGVLRGVTGSIFQALLTSGLAFSAMGVGRERIGSILGYNQFATLAGTGCGPLIYGVCRDAFGNFRGALVATSLPHLALGVLFLRLVITRLGAGGAYASLRKVTPQAGEEEASQQGGLKTAEPELPAARKVLPEDESSQGPDSPRSDVLQAKLEELIGAPQAGVREQLPGCVESPG